MARRVPKKASKVRRKSELLPWLSVVEHIKKCTHQDTYRLKVVGGLNGWQSMVSAWLSSGRAVLARSYPLQAEHGKGSIDELNVWAWSQIDTVTLSTALQVADSVCPLSSAEFVYFFDVMRSALLIYPDGDVHPDLVRMVNQDSQTMQLNSELKSDRRVIESIRNANTLQKLKDKSAQ